MVIKPVLVRSFNLVISGPPGGLPACMKMVASIKNFLMFYLHVIPLFVRSLSVEMLASSTTKLILILPVSLAYLEVI